MSDDPPPYIIKRPDGARLPLVLSSPHSGRHYTQDFLSSSRLDYANLRRSEDCYVDELFGDAPDIGAPLISALMPRAFIDLNREPYELDPEMFSDTLPGFVNSHSARVAAGLGTIARVVSSGNEIYRRPLTVGEAITRIELYYKPFHTALESLVQETLDLFGFCILLDCHSMPSSGLVPVAGSQNRPPDIVLGDRHGSTCAPEVMVWVQGYLRDLGYEVARNAPYAGGYTTEHYGKPHKGIHTLQLEINRSLYMDEVSLHRSGGLPQLRRDLNAFLTALGAFAASGTHGALRQRLSAE